MMMLSTLRQYLANLASSFLFPHLLSQKLRTSLPWLFEEHLDHFRQGKRIVDVHAVL